MAARGRCNLYAFTFVLLRLCYVAKYFNISSPKPMGKFELNFIWIIYSWGEGKRKQYLLLSQCFIFSMLSEVTQVSIFRAIMALLLFF